MKNGQGSRLVKHLWGSSTGELTKRVSDHVLDGDDGRRTVFLKFEGKNTVPICHTSQTRGRHDLETKPEIRMDPAPFRVPQAIWLGETEGAQNALEVILTRGDDVEIAGRDRAGRVKFHCAATDWTGGPKPRLTISPADPREQAQSSLELWPE